jgi:hypothetical protein
MARGDHGFSKVLPGPAMPDRSTPYMWATPETVLRLFLEWPARSAVGLRPSSTLWNTRHCTPMPLILESTPARPAQAHDLPSMELVVRLPRVRRASGAGEFHDQADNVLK